MPTLQGRFWVFTLNNWTQEQFYALMELDQDENVRYMVAGREVGENGTPHLQGYIEMKEKRTHNQMRTMIPGAWIDLRRGTQEQAIAYCKKDGQYDEFGEPSTGKRGPGKKKFTIDDLEHIEKTEGIATVAKLDITENQFKGYIFRRSFFQKPSKEFRKVDFRWYFGKTGTGKTRKAMFEFNDQDVFFKMSGPWFDGYQGEDIILIDDLREGGIEMDVLLRLTGGYAGRYPIKGGSVIIHPKIVVVTAPCRPEHMFSTSAIDNIDQVLRRITSMEEFVEEWTPPSPPRGEEGDDESKLLLSGYKFSVVELYTPPRFIYPVPRGPPTPIRLSRCPAGLALTEGPCFQFGDLVSSDEE